MADLLWRDVHRSAVNTCNQSLEWALNAENRYQVFLARYSRHGGTDAKYAEAFGEDAGVTTGDIQTMREALEVGHQLFEMLNQKERIDKLRRMVD